MCLVCMYFLILSLGGGGGSGGFFMEQVKLLRGKEHDGPWRDVSITADGRPHGERESILWVELTKLFFFGSPSPIWVIDVPRWMAPSRKEVNTNPFLTCMCICGLV